jgi:uncharacterized membrane protein (DUF485 family)
MWFKPSGEIPAYRRPTKSTGPNQVLSALRSNAAQGEIEILGGWPGLCLELAHVARKRKRRPTNRCAQIKIMETSMIELLPLVPVDSMSSPTDNGPEAPTSQSVSRSPSFRKLMSIKRRAIAPLLGISLMYSFGVALLSGFAHDVMSTKVSGSFTLGYLLVLGIYGVCWLVAIAYVVVANRLFDSQALCVVASISGEAS